MLVILSPAKRLSPAPCPPGLSLTTPAFLEEARELGYPQVAAYLASRAKSRISGASDINRHLEDIGREINLSDGDRYGDDMWKRIHKKCMDEDCERMKSKLEKIS